MISLPLHPLPEKPIEGHPCNGCGLCCAMEICAVGRAIFPGAHAPCPGLEFEDGRTWCGVVRRAERDGFPSAGLILRTILGIGVACDSGAYDSERECAKS